MATPGVRMIQASCGAFAAILEHTSVATWGHAEYGGDCSQVRNKLRNVQQIQATSRAFAAILGDGSVVTWGDLLQPGPDVVDSFLFGNVSKEKHLVD